MNWMLSCCCCTSAFGIHAMMIMDHHGTENGILFFFRPSHSSPYEKEIQHFHSNHQSVSSWFTDQKPNKVLLNTNIEKYRFSQHAAPTDSSMTPAGQAAQKQGCGGLYLWGSLPLFLLSWKHYQNRFASIPLCSHIFLLSIPRLHLQSTPTTSSTCRDQQSLFPEHKGNVFLPLLSSAGITDRRGKVYLSLLD